MQQSLAMLIIWFQQATSRTLAWEGGRESIEGNIFQQDIRRRYSQPNDRAEHIELAIRRAKT